MFTLLLIPFSLIFYDISFIILPALILEFTYYCIYKNKLTLEDQYQIDINRKNNTKVSLIYVTIEYKDLICLENVLKNGIDLLEGTKLQFIPINENNNLPPKHDIYLNHYCK